MVQEKVSSLAIFNDAAMPWAFPMIIAGEDRVSRVFLPGPKERLGPRYSQRIRAAASATAAARIEQIIPFAAVQDERPLDHSTFPSSVVTQNLFRFAYQLQTAVGQRLSPKDGGQLAAVAVFLPDQESPAVFVGHRYGIDRARRLRYQRA